MQVNPIIIKDLKLKMRSFKTSSMTMKYLGILGIIAIISFLPQITNRNNYYSFNPQIVLNAYVILSIIQYIMLIVITPLIIAESMFGERERNTFDLLLCTSFSSGTIIIGKLVVSMTHIFLLIITSLPIMAIVFLYGGVSITSLCLLLFTYLVSATLIAGVSIFYATLLKNINFYKLFTYLTVILIIIGLDLIIVKGFYLSGLTNNFLQPIELKLPWYLETNPVYGFGSIIDSNSISFIQNAGGYEGSVLLPRFWGFDMKPWLMNMGVYLVLTIVFIFFAAKNINPFKGFFYKKKVR